jgi:hypothetical protein
MWKPEHRLAAERRGLRYPSDMLDSEWTLIAPLIPPARRGGGRQLSRGLERNVLCVTPAVLTVNSIRLAQAANRAMLPSIGDTQTDLVGSHRAVPIKGFARGGDPDTAPSAQCAAKKIAEAARFQQFRSSGLCQPLTDGAARLRPVAL